jgi:hypothetical protein
MSSSSSAETSTPFLPYVPGTREKKSIFGNDEDEPDDSTWAAHGEDRSDEDNEPDPEAEAQSREDTEGDTSGYE